MPDNIKVCSIYAPPENSVYYSSNFWDELESDITQYTTPTTPFMIIGDTNTRVGNLSEFVEDNTPHLTPLVRLQKPNVRNNCDNLIKQNGRNLIELCRSFHMQIANGRFPGDAWGNYTHHNINKGESTVDFAIVSDTLFDHIEDFKVLPQKEHSDHSKIVITIKNTKVSNKAQ